MSVVYYAGTWCTFKPKLEKIKQTTPKNNSIIKIIFQEIELSDSKIKRFLIFSKESFSYISGNGTLHFSAPSRKNKENLSRKRFLIFQEMELLGSNIKKIQETETPKIFFIFS